MEVVFHPRFVELFALLENPTRMYGGIRIPALTPGQLLIDLQDVLLDFSSYVLVKFDEVFF